MGKVSQITVKNHGFIVLGSIIKDAFILMTRMPCGKFLFEKHHKELTHYFLCIASKNNSDLPSCFNEYP
jgi:hypothetical protein